MLPELRQYDALYREFRWEIPARYNMGVDACDVWAARDPSRLAILHVKADGREEAISFGALRDLSNRLANVLRAHGVARGDRVAILLPQTPEAAAAHIAIYKLAAIAVPLAIQFGADALKYR
jgi:acetyl-CoA synthetase